MRTDRIVLFSEHSHASARVKDVEEPFPVQAFASEAAMEAFREGSSSSGNRAARLTFQPVLIQGVIPTVLANIDNIRQAW